MGFRRIKYYVPAFYHRFLPPFFEQEIPAEVFADCTNCPLTASSGEEMENEISRPFSPLSKCCTFIPKLPNFFAGAVFSDPDMVAAQSLLTTRIKGKRGVFPQGIYPDKKYRLLYEFGRKNGFGRSSLLKCPYYVSGDFNCTLWKYRESICATWFCKYLCGEAGKAFWDEMRDFFKLVQEKLSELAITELGLPVVPPYGDDEQLSVEDIDDLPMHPREYRRRWQHWEGREEEFYTRCFEIIGRMEVSAYQALSENGISERMKALEEKYNEMLALPEYLMVNPAYALDEMIPGFYRLKLKSYIERNDTTITFAFDVPKSVIDGFREGKSTGRVFEDLNREKGIQLGKDLVLSLFHHGILTGVGTD